MQSLRSQVCDIFFAPDSAHSQSLRPTLVLYPNVIPCLWRMCSVAVASMTNAGFTAKPRSHIMLWNPFASDAPNAAAYSSAPALLFAQTFCFRVYAFKVCLPSIITPALDDFRVSWQPAQPESVNTVSSSASTPYSNTCHHCLSRFKYLANLFSLTRLCRVGFDILWHNTFTMNVMSARSWLRNKHLATCDLYL